MTRKAVKVLEHKHAQPALPTYNSPPFVLPKQFGLAMTCVPPSPRQDSPRLFSIRSTLLLASG
eukprot:5156136-Amphidinium_carterae.2